ncbi:hypothetical protein EZS27_013520 [termite gut metagenome]|uniref:Uncharacterized protein n=1 Tax=termite gut metagenome TaxID=433724 RepID=A0A5J4RZL6_9ZZZZ
MKYRNTYFLIVIVFLFLPITLSSQPTFKDSTDVYDYWTKRGIIEIVYACMQDYVAISPNNPEKQGMEEYKIKYIDGLDSLKKIDTDFESLSSFLKNNNWVGVASKQLIPLIEKYQKRDNLDENFFSITTQNNNNNCWKNTKANVLKKYNEGLTQIVNNKKKEEDPGAKAKLEIKGKPTDTKIIYYFLGGLVIGIILTYSYLRKETYSFLYKKTCTEESKDRLIIQLKAEYKELFNENISLRKEKEELLNENISLGEKIENFKSQSINNNVNPKPDTQEIVNQKFIYFDIPKTDGSFKNPKTQQGNDTFYKIELDDSKQIGKLFFISGYDLRALDNIDYYLNPVCEIQNIEDRIGAKRIKMVKTGTVILLNGDSWKIKEKVKIKLI